MRVRRITFLIAVLFCLNLRLTAQDFEWVKQFGASGGTVTASKVVADRQGNVYTLGYFAGTVDFDPGPGSYTIAVATATGNGNNYVCKLDSSGNFLWVRDLGLSTYYKHAYNLAVDKYGNPLITGDFSGSFDFDPGAGTYNLLAESFINCFILKLSASGNFMWAKSFEQDNSPNWGFAFSACHGYFIALDSAQNIYVSGVLRGCVDFDPDTNVSYPLCGITTYSANMSGPDDTFFMIKLDSAGKFIYAKANASLQILGGAQITVQRSGEVIVSGFNSANFTPSSYFVRKYASNGATVWAKSISGPVQPNSIATDRYRNIYVIGSFTDDIDFDPGPGVSILSSPGPGALFILKLDSLGNFRQVQQMNEPNIYYPTCQIATDAADAVYISGSFKGTVDFAPNIGQTVNLSSTNGSGFILKLDRYGEFEWVKQVGENSSCMVNDLELDNFGNLYTTGSFTGTVDFDPAGTYNLSAFGSQDAFVHKLSWPLITGLREQAPGNELSLYPNPTASVVYLNTTSYLDRAVCKVMDISGRLIQEKRNITGRRFDMDLSEQPKGLYLLEVSDSKTISRIKLIKE